MCSFVSVVSITNNKQLAHIHFYGALHLGEPLKWEEKCRIKHLPTRCYLAVEKRGNGNSHYKVSARICRRARGGTPVSDLVVLLL